MARFIFQRAVDGMWIDAEKFEDRETAIRARDFATRQQNARIDGRGGTGYTMERPQRTRVIEVIDQ